MKLDVFNKENKKLEEINIDDALLMVEGLDDLVHDVLLSYQQNVHTGSSNTLTRAEVRGGGKKPWKQKGTGRARHGSTRSPIWRHGGITFGPKPFKARIDVNKLTKRQALQAVLAGKIKDGEIKVIDALAATAKTKEFAGMLKTLELNGKKLLVITDKTDREFIKKAGNIRNVNIVTAKEVNAYDMIIHPKVLASKKSVEEIIRRIG